jgi:hypothetical protein
MKRLLLAGLCAGIAMYIWSTIAHVVLPLGSMGLSQIPNEQPVLAALNASLGSNGGLYIFPSMDPKGSMDDYSKKLATSPSGILAYTPPGAKALDPSQLITEFFTEMVEAFLIVFLLPAKFTTVSARTGFAATMGLLAAIVTNISYWNWYHFSATYTASYMLVEIVGFTIAGAVAGLILRPKR